MIRKNNIVTQVLTTSQKQETPVQKDFFDWSGKGAAKLILPDVKFGCDNIVERVEVLEEKVELFEECLKNFEEANSGERGSEEENAEEENSGDKSPGESNSEEENSAKKDQKGTNLSDAHLRYFFGDITSSEAGQILREKNIPNSFLLRQNDNIYKLSWITSNSGLRHAVINEDKGQFSIQRNKRFPTIEELVRHYQTFEKSGILSLLTPVAPLAEKVLDLEKKVKAIERYHLLKEENADENSPGHNVSKEGTSDNLVVDTNENKSDDKNELKKN